MAGNKRAVFFDRDGVINDVIDRGKNFYVKGKKVRWTAPFQFNEFRLKPGVEELLKRIGEAGFLRILLTNQPDIAYGLLTTDQHNRIMDEVKKLPFEDIFICLHSRFDNCICKKPKPGMLFEATRKHGINLQSSYVIGDSDSDIKAGDAAGCTTILITDNKLIPCF